MKHYITPTYAKAIWEIAAGEKNIKISFPSFIRYISIAQEDEVTEGTDLLYICLNIRQYKTHKSSVFFSKGMFYKICEYPRWTSK